MQIVIEFPYVFIQSTIYSVIVYAMIGFEWTATKFLWYLFFMYFTLLYFTFYGMMAVAITPNHQISSIVSASFYAIWNAFSGFLIPRTVSYIDYSMYALEVILKGLKSPRNVLLIFQNQFQWYENHF